MTAGTEAAKERRWLRGLMGSSLRVIHSWTERTWGVCGDQRPTAGLVLGMGWGGEGDQLTEGGSLDVEEVVMRITIQAVRGT